MDENCPLKETLLFSAEYSSSEPEKEGEEND